MKKKEGGHLENYLIEDLSKAVKKSMRDGFGEELVKLGEKNKKVVVLTADLMESTKTDLFKAEFPERFFEMGIAEQNMMGVAAGMALSGKIPFVCSFACFNPGRNWEQMRVSVALSKTNVKVVGGHSGFGNGFDGGNQQMFEDLALARVLPNMVVVAPVDYEQMKKAVEEVANHVGGVYMRMTKPSRAVITTKDTPFILGKAQLFREGKELTLIASGGMVYESLLASEKFGYRVEMINVHTIKPLDRETIVKSVSKTGRVITVEEHSVIGGLGGAVAELLSTEMPVRVRRLGMNDCFGESGEVEELMSKYGLDNVGIAKVIEEELNR